MKDMLEKMQKAQNVIKPIILLIFFIACGVSNKNIIDYDLKKNKSKSGIAYIHLSFFDYNNKDESISAFSNINGVFAKSNEIEVKPGVYNIESYHIGYKTQIIKNIRVKKGDSITIKSYLKEYYPVIE